MSVSEKQAVFLSKKSELDIIKTFECGQCFRWNADENGVYTGVSQGRVLRLWTEEGKVLCSSAQEDLAFWRDYFDLSEDYGAAASRFTEPDYLKICAEYGAGIRILRQEPWEAFCSFIISQCNNIPRIKKIVEALCRSFGDELEDGLFSFPGAERIAPLKPEDLAPLHSGYRAQYILDAARAVDGGKLDFQELSKAAPEEAMARLREINGVGPKVANCFMLYGLHIMDRFPVDVWMKRALTNHFPSDFDPKTLGEFSGLAQQYIFYYTRSVEHAHK